MGGMAPAHYHSSYCFTAAVVSVSGFLGWEDDKVIHKDNKPSFSNHVSGWIIHKALKGGWRIGETKEHDSGFKETFVGNEGSFALTLLYPHPTLNLVKIS